MRRNHNAFTLIEVLAALAILSSALVVLLAAQQRSLRLLREQDDKEIAAALARELITDWKLQRSYRPPSDGWFAHPDDWRWTRLEEPSEDRDSKLRRVTLTILKRAEQSQDTVITRYVWLESDRAKS